MITADDLRKCTLRHVMHFDGPRGPKGFFGDIKRCNEFPRLTQKETARRATRTVEIEIRVDDIKVADLDAAAAALNIPPTISDAERAALELIPTEFTKWPLVVSGDLTFEILQNLVAKDLVEMERGLCRRKP